ncbi:DNA repair protein RadA, partial [Nocardia fluminea]
VRKVTGLGRRLAEAERLGFTTALVPPGSEKTNTGTMRIHEVGDLRSALRLAELRKSRASREVVAVE